jgi:hypothetical protein
MPVVVLDGVQVTAWMQAAIVTFAVLTGWEGLRHVRRRSQRRRLSRGLTDGFAGTAEAVRRVVQPVADGPAPGRGEPSSEG